MAENAVKAALKELHLLVKKTQVWLLLSIVIECSVY